MIDPMKKLVIEFKNFAVKGNAVDMAIGIMIGAAFGTVVRSLVADILMPPIGLLFGGVDFSNLFWVLKDGEPAGPYLTALQATESGAVTINYGVFLNSVVAFLIIGFVLFLMVRGINRLKEKEGDPAPNTAPCPECTTIISMDARRCPHCTSKVRFT